MHTVDAVKKALIEKLEVPESDVKICTGSVDEIGDTDLMALQCPIRYIITVDKLREGWDCPWAYVLGSIGNTATATAVEQLIGRILRMPNACPHERASPRSSLCVCVERQCRADGDATTRSDG